MIFNTKQTINNDFKIGKNGRCLSVYFDFNFLKFKKFKIQ